MPQQLVLVNQFGEESINYVEGFYIPLPGSDNVIIMKGATAPVNGTTGDDIAGKGSLYIALDTGLLYQQTGAISNPTWVQAGSGTTGGLLTGLAIGAGTVSAADTILTAFNKLVGNTQNKTVLANVLTAFVASTNTPVADTDTLLEGLEKLQGQITAAAYAEASPSLTFDHSVGAKTIVTRKVGKVVVATIPAGAIADGAGTVCATTAGLAVGLRPAAAITFSALVIDNGTTRKAGQVVIGSDGVITFSVLGAGFTNAQAAGWDSVSVSYAVA